MTDREQQIEREQVSQVFGLTGGELSDAPWTYVHESYGMSTDPENKYMPRDANGRTTDPADVRVESFRYWYDGAPEYTTEHTERGGTTDKNGRDVRTVVTCALFGMPPDVLWDAKDGARWERVAFYQSSGETECPGRGDTDGPAIMDGGREEPGPDGKMRTVGGYKVGKVTRAHAKLTPKHAGWTENGKHFAPRRAECPLCSERIGSAHGYIYLGDGWGEAVYVRMTPAVEWEIVDHGCDGEQYFPGCGVSFTEYTDVATGIGDSAREAAEDALDQMGTTVDDIPSALEDEVHKLSSAPSALANDPDISPEWHHYVSIRWRVVKH